MKNFKLLLITSLILLMISASSCSKVKGDGDVISHQRTTSSFSGINLAMDAKVYYRYGTDYSLTITAQENILNVIESKVENDILIIQYENGVVVGPHEQVVIDVYGPFCDYFLISGSGSMYCQGIDTVNHMDMIITGSGDLEAGGFYTTELVCTISGSGNMKGYDGRAVTENTTITGSGNMDLGDVAADTAYATISGSGNMTLNVLNLLNATITGSGNIRYYGSPVVEKNITGSGSVIKL